MSLTSEVGKKRVQLYIDEEVFEVKVIGMFWRVKLS